MRTYMGMRYLGRTERRLDPEDPNCHGDCPRWDDCRAEDDGVCLVRDEDEARAEEENDARREYRELYGSHP